MTNAALKSNLRHHARISTKLLVKITNQSDQTRTAHLENVSRAGALVACDRETLETLIPHSHGPSCPEISQLTIDIPVPLSNVANISVQSICKVVHVQRKSRDAYLIGLSFVQFSNQGFVHIDNFIRHKFRK